MKKIYSLLLAFMGFCLLANAQSQLGEIRGKVLDSKTKKPLDFVSVTVVLNGLVKAQVLTDDDGAFIVKTLQPGSYTIQVSYIGFRNYIKTDINVVSDEITFTNIPMESTEGGTELGAIIIKDKPPLIRPDGIGGGQKTGAQIMALGTRSTNSIAGLTAGVDSRSGATPTIRGARPDGTAYYIDGVRVQGGASISIPQNAIDNMQVITSGTPAQYGDFIGGAIAISTKSPSRNWSKSFEYTTSSPFNGYLDNSNYNELQMGVSGPIKIENKGKGDKERVLLGFSVYGSGIFTRDNRLPAVDVYQVNDAKLRQIEENPLVAQAGGGFVPAGEYLVSSDLEKVGYRQNASSYQASLQGNFTYSPSNNINIRMGYQAVYNAGSSASSYSQQLMNYSNNPFSKSYTIRPYIQFTQSFTKKNEEEAKKSLISGAFYSVRFSYERSYGETTSPEHGTDIFNYGYLGTFDKYSTNTYERVNKEFGATPDTYRILMPDGSIRVLNLSSYVKQNGSVDTSLIYHQSNINRIKGNYTRSIYDYYNATGSRVSNLGQLRGLGGLANGDEPNGVYSNLWASPGGNQANYSKSLNETYTLYVQSEASIAPKRNPKAKHDLQFGFTYEQQFTRSYGLSAGGLWTLMRQLVNNQLVSGLDTGLGSAQASFDANGVFQDTITFNRTVVAEAQKDFDKKLRSKLIEMGARDANGKLIDQYSLLNTDGYDPSMYSLDMFTADELLNDGNSYISYSGYNHKGERVKGKPSVQQFLNDRTIGAYQPVYMAAWVQDKFVFKDLIVRLGVRMERFDANQMVLKDPYSLAPVYTAGDVRRGDLKLQASSIASSVGDDYVVYVNSETPSTASNLQVSGYRDGNNWYDRNGNPVTDPTTLYKTSAETPGVNINQNTPYLVNDGQKEPDANSFTDYSPDVKFLPRIWFSFPISTTSQFFGTYDVLAQRPTGGTNIAQMDDYFYLRNRLNNAIGNPNLRMTQVTDYQIGFRQQIGQDASLGIMGSYREFRNLVQLYQFNQAWPYNYISYSNIDFSTVKSIQLEYELRELGNVNISANYMLQFANGTGSNSGQSSALIQAGVPNQRSLFPLDYDTRHTVKGTIDFHYKEGKEYNGPVVNGKKIFENAGINMIFNLTSGRPYTQTTNPVAEVMSGVAQRAQVKGTINGANLPSQFYSDINVDKYFTIRSEGLDGKSSFYRIRVFLSVQNVFNNINVLSVYRYTGSAYDDGFITSTYAESQLNAATSAQSMSDLYNARVVDPNRFALPRLTRLGVSLYF
jgi:hypothetical protein